MKKSSDVIMVSIVSGAGFQRNVELVAMFGGYSLDLARDPSSRRFI